MRKCHCFLSRHRQPNRNEHVLFVNYRKKETHSPVPQDSAERKSTLDWLVSMRIDLPSPWFFFNDRTEKISLLAAIRVAEEAKGWKMHVQDASVLLLPTDTFRLLEGYLRSRLLTNWNNNWDQSSEQWTQLPERNRRSRRPEVHGISRVKEKAVFINTWFKYSSRRKRESLWHATGVKCEEGDDLSTIVWQEMENDQQ